MKRVVLFGHSFSALKAVEALKALGQQIETILISSENTLPYFKHLLPDLTVKKLSAAKVLIKTLPEWQNEQVNMILAMKVARINFKRGRITLENKETIDFDYLFLGDFLPQNFAAIKGNNKNGIFHLKRFSGVADFLKCLPVVETVAVISNQLAGIKTALNLAQTKKKEVLLVTSHARLLNDQFSDGDAAWLEQQVQEAGVRLLKEQHLAELLGDHDLKAIRLSGGKVFSCQAALTDAEEPDLRLLKETDLAHHQRVMVNEFYQTNFQNVFAFDTVCDRIPDSDWDVAENYPVLAETYGKIVASRITGQEYTPSGSPLQWLLTINQTPVVISKDSGSMVIQAQNELAVQA